MSLTARKKPRSVTAALLALALFVTAAPVIPTLDAAYAQPPLSFASVLNVETAAFPLRSATGDLNGDGFDDVVLSLVEPELVLGAETTEGMQVLLNDGEGNLVPQAPIIFPNVAVPPDPPEPPHIEGLAIGDFNGDGVNDVAAVFNVDSFVQIFVNDGTGALTAGQSFPTAFRASEMTAVDLTGNGLMDLAVIGPRDGTVQIHLQTAPGTFTAGQLVELALNNDDRPDPFDIVAGDVDGDGRVDLAVSHFRARDADGDRDGRVDILRNDGNGTFTRETVMLTNGGSDPRLCGLALGDLNGDGRADLVVTSLLGGTWVVLAGSGGSFDPQTAQILSGLDTVDVAIADFDMDDRLDVAILNQPHVDPPLVAPNITIDVYVNPDGNGQLAHGTLLATGVPGPTVAEGMFLAVGDFDGLHKADILVAHPETGTLLGGAGEPGLVSLFRNLAAGRLSQLVIAPPTPDGRDGWYVTEPAFSFELTRPATVYFSWDPAAVPSEFTEVTDVVVPVIPGIGEHTLRWYADDGQGIVETVRSRVVRYDPAMVRLPVSTLIVNPATPNGFNGWYRTAPTFSFQVDKPATVYFTWDVEADPADFIESTEETLPVIPGVGEHTLRWFAVDLLGNVEASIQGRVIRYDPDMRGPCSLSGSVTDRRSGEPVAGVTVTLVGPVNRTFVTDETGQYAFTGLPEGRYIVSAAAPGLRVQPSRRNVTLRDRVGKDSAIRNFRTRPL